MYNIHIQYSNEIIQKEKKRNERDDGGREKGEKTRKSLKR